jgi:hypothetical protein
MAVCRLAFEKSIWMLARAATILSAIKESDHWSDGIQLRIGLLALSKVIC